MKDSPWVRAMALAFSTVMVGGLIGFSWEHVGAHELQGEAEAQEPLPLDAALTPPGAGRRSAVEQAALERALSHFPPYPRGGRPEVLAVDYLGPKAPVAVAWLSTEDSSDEVLEHYRRVLEDKGLPPIGLRHHERAGFVGYWDPASEEVYLVSTLAQGGETLIFVSAAQVGPLLKEEAQVSEWLPGLSQLQQSWLERGP